VTRSMIPISISIILLLFTSIAIAEVETVDIGPFSTSFEINTTGQYNISTDSTVCGGDGLYEPAYIDYPLTISIPGKGEATIGIGWVDSTVDVNRMNSLYSTWIQGAQIENISIDGKPGIIARRATNIEAFFWPDYANNEAKIRCHISSTLPWYPETKSLLDTIHIAIPSQEQRKNLAFLAKQCYIRQTSKN